ncbi:MAG: hypothetical protein EOP04_33395, partial [Proteobacteria bacterium]
MNQPVTAKKILVLKLSSLGDVLASTPLFRIIKEQKPDAEIDHLVMEHCAVATESNPYIRKQILSPFFPTGKLFKDVRTLIKLIAILRRNKYDLAIILHRHWLFQILCKLSRIQRLIGFESSRNFFLDKTLRYRFDRQRTIQELHVLELAGFELTEPEALEFYIDPLKVKSEIRSQLPDRYIACNPGGGNPHAPATNRIWPFEKYVRLFREIGMPVVLLGKGPEDEVLGAQISSASEVGVPVTNM